MFEYINNIGRKYMSVKKILQTWSEFIKGCLIPLAELYSKRHM